MPYSDLADHYQQQQKIAEPTNEDADILEVQRKIIEYRQTHSGCTLGQMMADVGVPDVFSEYSFVMALFKIHREGKANKAEQATI